MKIDPYKHKEAFLKWKDNTVDGITGISKVNSDIILQYISDMENGLNISSKSVKGPRSYIRLNNLKQRMIFLAKQTEQHCDINLIDLSEEQIIKFFNAMRNGTIKRLDGKCYRSVVDFVKPFKAFWHWHMKVNKKKGIEMTDITEDLDVSNPKPKWVYLSQEQVKKLCDHAKPEYKVLIMFLYDTGIRSPTELINIRVSDVYDEFKKLNINQEIVKKGSFARKINLMLCSDLLRQYIKEKRLQANEQLFNISPPVVNQYLKRLARRVLGDSESLAGEKYCNLTMYDFRHCSCCYWLPRYKSESALKYRFGWKKSDKIHYYSELLGMKDTIREEDMLIDLTKTDIEKRLLKTEQENEILKEKLEAYNADVVQLKTLVHIYLSKLKQLKEMQISR
ncbi:MAG: site-specific integrase [Gammaproteobacteria bacterium]|nr:site-specific integrase [Gammaproteobacteria bacterium]